MCRKVASIGKTPKEMGKKLWHLGQKMGGKMVTKESTAKAYKSDVCRHQKEEILFRRVLLPLHRHDDDLYSMMLLYFISLRYSA